MSAAKAMSCKATAQAMGMKPARSGTYRRSTTTKAPRKRTFIANMTKYSDRAVEGGAGADWMLSQGRAAGMSTVCQAMCRGPAAGGEQFAHAAGLGGGDNGNNGRLSARRTGGNGEEGGNLGGGRSLATGLPRTVLLGAGVLLASLVLAPGQAAAGDGQAQGLPGLRKAMAVAAAAGRRTPGAGPAGDAILSGASLCLNMPPPAPGAMARNGARKGPGGARAHGADAIVYGCVELTDAERRMAANRQLFLRETVRVV